MLDRREGEGERGRGGDQFCHTDQFSGLLIIFTNIPMIESYSRYKSAAASRSMYLHSTANSSHTCVSAASPSLSLSLLTNELGYRRLRQASAIFPQTLREQRRI